MFYKKQTNIILNSIQKIIVNLIGYKDVRSSIYRLF